MGTQGKSVDRFVIGVTAVVLLLMSAALLLVPTTSAGELWQGVFVRSGLMMGALWLALPSAKHEAAWARVSWSYFGGVLLAIVLIARFRVPLKFLVPAIFVCAFAFVILRPRRPQRPARD